MNCIFLVYDEPSCGKGSGSGYDRSEKYNDSESRISDTAYENIGGLQLMHDSKYFIFLVCEVDVSVCGIVDVIYREGGSDTRRPMFNAVEDLKDDNESVISFGS